MILLPHPIRKPRSSAAFLHLRHRAISRTAEVRLRSRPLVLRPRITPGVLLSGGSGSVVSERRCVPSPDIARLMPRLPGAVYSHDLAVWRATLATPFARFPRHSAKQRPARAYADLARSRFYPLQRRRHVFISSIRCSTNSADSRRPRRLRPGRLRTQSLYDAAARDRLAFWDRAGDGARLDDAVDDGARVDAAARELVRRRPAQRRGQLHRPAPRPARAATRPRSSGRASRATGASTPTGSWASEVGRCANALKALGVQARRSRRDLPADDSRSGHRHAGLRPDRRRALGGLRRLLRRGAARPDQRRRGHGAHHRRRRLPARQRASPQAVRRRGDRRMSQHPACRGRASASRRRGRRGLRHHEGGTRSLVARPAGAGLARLRTAEPMDAEDLLFILYTSGTTGKPKGIVHTTGGYLTQVAATTKYVFDLKDDDVFWCTADIGWVTGHSYVVYGPLANGATVLMYEGAPDWPERDRFWQICARYGVTVFYTAPTAIRAFMKWGTEHPGAPRPLAAPPARQRRASRSTPRRGSGITSTSAASAARSWTPGGRPRPAGS